MRVLALEPFYGGSHRAFLDGWVARSIHQFELLTLPARHWKWRMRHAAATFADDVRQRVATGDRWDVVFASDMLALAEFRGLAPESVRQLPAVLYFHENQWTYPVRFPRERDRHFAFTNWTSALAADQVWFNSAFHRDDFLRALQQFLPSMPDKTRLPPPEQIASKSRVEYPGASVSLARGSRLPGPLRILWAARWEHDKGPETFFHALRQLQASGCCFELNVIGQTFDLVPPVMEAAHNQWAPWIRRWGYQPNRHDYEATLVESDVIVSTAQHEFFGISVVEAILAGAYPLLPSRLSYPELLPEAPGCRTAEFFYSGSAESLARALALLAQRLDDGALWQGDHQRARRLAARFDWLQRAPPLDASLQQAAQRLPFPT